MDYTPPPKGTTSLYLTSQRLAIRCAQQITTVGGVPYEHLIPILAKITSPNHFNDLENSNPDLREDTGKYWQNFIKRDIPGYQNRRQKPYTEPDELAALGRKEDDPETWYELYLELKVEAAEDMEREEAKLKKRLAGIQREKEGKKVELAKSNRELDMRYVPRPRGPGPFTGVRRIGPLKSQMSPIQRWKHEAAQKRGSATLMSRPTHALHKASVNAAIGVVRTAPPQGFAESVRETERKREEERRQLKAHTEGRGENLHGILLGRIRAPRPAPPKPPMHAPRDDDLTHFSPPKRKRSDAVEEYDPIEEREKRLKMMQTGRPAISSSSTASARSPRSSHVPRLAGLTQGFLEDSDDEINSANERYLDAASPPPQTSPRKSSSVSGLNGTSAFIIPTERPKLTTVTRKLSTTPKPPSPTLQKQPKPAANGLGTLREQQHRAEVAAATAKKIKESFKQKAAADLAAAAKARPAPPLILPPSGVKAMVKRDNEPQLFMPRKKRVVVPTNS